MVCLLNLHCLQSIKCAEALVRPKLIQLATMQTFYKSGSLFAVFHQITVRDWEVEQNQIRMS